MLIELKNGPMTMAISTLGAEPQSLKLDGREYIWQGNKEYWFRRAPLLFPMIGPTRDNQVGINGKVYDMPNNGFARDNEFTFVSQTENSATFVLEDTPFFREHYYPYGFKLTVTYTLNEDGYEAKADITAKDDLYYVFGWHPAFNIDINGENTDLERYTLNFEAEEKLTRKYVKDGKFVYQEGFVDGDTYDIRYEEIDKGPLTFDNVKSTEVTLTCEGGEHGVTATMGDMTTFTAWTCFPKHGQYLCLEPMVSFGSPEREFDIEKMEEARFLKAGETKTYVNSWRVF